MKRKKRQIDPNTEPLVTISIPTYNSARTLADCLSALHKQTYRNIEINIIDNYSTDDTLIIGKRYGIVKIKKLKGSLLLARYEGVKMGTGKYILLLDSDQLLYKTTIERALKKMEKEAVDMLALEEGVFQANTFVEKLFQMDRKLINELNNLSPFTGVIMPRFFRSTLLRKAYEKIPKQIIPKTGGPDHAIVYYEAWLISKRVDVLKKAVTHIEPYTLKLLMRKFYRWGYTSVEAHFGPYSHLMRQKERFRTGLFTKGLYKESVCSILLLILKGIAFKTGYYKGVIDRYNKKEHEQKNTRK